tara:strand:- start:631 stop:1449 length:819 start_codon:yes stop_codon:yes gene_type:complete
LYTQPTLLVSTLAIAAAVLYLLAAGRQLFQLEMTSQKADRSVTLLATFALIAHSYVALTLSIESGWNLGFYRVASLIFLVMSVTSLGMLIIRPLHMLLIVMFPFAALSVLVSTFAPATGQPLIGLDQGVLIHVSASLIAYALLALASLQAIIVAVQSKQLRAHQFRGVVKLLPPLERMESMLWELAIAGVAILTLAIISGVLYVDDLFAQHLIHKTVLTVVSWLVFIVMLTAHWIRGWRIKTAVSLILTGFTLLTLGFFGSKLVLELLLQQS